MLTNFNLFGFEHILALIIPIVIGTLFIVLAYFYPTKKRMISLLFALTIILIRGTRYGFDMNIGAFRIQDLLSLHVCHLDLILLLICLIKPSEKLFIFTFLIGIPTALAVALMPGTTHAAPGLLRAVFFIMSHIMLVMGSIYLLIVYHFKITKKDIYFYYLYSLIGIVLIYIYNLITNSNFMYLMEGPKNTVLETLYRTFGPLWYIIILYGLLVFLLTLLYLIYNTINKLFYIGKS